MKTTQKQKAVLMTMARISCDNGDGTFGIHNPEFNMRVSVKEIRAKMPGMSKFSIGGVLASLVADGLIQYSENVGGFGDIYSLTCDPYLGEK